jgi:8-hydroxy-5-deazaflavin:NADPH oxidoreductase
MVGRALAERLAELGHDVVIGTRDAEQTLARTEPDQFGAPPYAVWQDANRVSLLPLAEAGGLGELVINATQGANSLAALEATGAANLAGKVLLDLALPRGFATMPPHSLVASTDSLGEQAQRAFPEPRVVKTLNAVFKDAMVEPSRLPGSHNFFLAGDDAEAKETARGLLQEFDWPEEVIIDLGGIGAARTTEMHMMLYFTLVGVFDSFEFNIAVVRP